MHRSRPPHQNPSSPWLRFAFVATVAGISFGMLGVLLWSRRGSENRRLEVVLRMERGYDWDANGPPGPLFSDGDLQRALRSATGILADREDIRRLRSALRVRVERPEGRTSARVRIMLAASNQEQGRAVLERLSQAALLRIHLGPWIQAHHRRLRAARDETATARNDELDSQRRLHAVVQSWLEQAGRPRKQLLSTNAPVRQPLNPRWEELLEKRTRLTSRVDQLLETHRRSHPLVVRLTVELERLREELDDTPRMVAHASTPTNGQGALFATVAAGSVDKSAIETGQAERQEELRREFARAWESLLQSRQHFEASFEAGYQPPSDVDDYPTIARVERSSSQPSPPQGSRGYIVLLVALAGGVMIAGGDRHLQRKFAANAASVNAEKLWNIALAVMAASTGLLALSAVYWLVMERAF